jgi:nitroreductase
MSTKDAPRRPPRPDESALEERPMFGDDADLGTRPLPPDTVGLLEGLASTRAIRRYLDEPVPPEALRAILFAATRAPSGSNRQPFRFIVLTDGPKAAAAKRLIGEGARRMWNVKRAGEQYDEGSGAVTDSPKARVARAMEHLVDHFERVPVVVLPCVVRTWGDDTEGIGPEGPSVFPACQNLLLAARALGYGGVFTGFHVVVEAQLRELLELPERTHIVATITLGKPAGRQGPVRRRPLGELVHGETWGEPPHGPSIRRTLGSPRRVRRRPPSPATGSRRSSGRSTAEAGA